MESNESGRVGRSVTIIRFVLVLGILPILVFLCLQTNHAQLKGMPTETWRLVPLLIAQLFLL